MWNRAPNPLSCTLGDCIHRTRKKGDRQKHATNFQLNNRQSALKLEADGYVVRKQHKEDKRTVSVELGETVICIRRNLIYLCNRFSRNIMRVCHLKN